MHDNESLTEHQQPAPDDLARLEELSRRAEASTDLKELVAIHRELALIQNGAAEARIHTTLNIGKVLTELGSMGTAGQVVNRAIVRAMRLPPRDCEDAMGRLCGVLDDGGPKP